MSGQPGADDPTIFVRGIGSLDAARATPLMMVDGVERSFYRLDPNEVESITVLKDASATAVFGVRGANGVILVTTKRGAAGKMSVSMSSEAGFQKPIRLYQYCNSYEYGMVYNESRLNDDPTLTPDELPFKEHVLQAFKDHSQPLIYPDTDWQDYLLKDAAFQMKNNISVSGGTDNVRFFTSIGVVNQDGLYKSFDTDYDSNIRYNRYNWRANLDIDITKTTTLSINMGGRIEDNRIPITKDNGKFDPQLYFALPFAGAGLYEGKWIRGAEANLPFTSGALQNGDAFEEFIVFHHKFVEWMIVNGINPAQKQSRSTQHISTKMTKYSSAGSAKRPVCPIPNPQGKDATGIWKPASITTGPSADITSAA